MRITEPILSYELSLAVAWSTGALPHACYANAFHACEALAAWPDRTLVEGWIVIEQATQVALIEHAWCEVPGLILDPSIALLGPRDLCQAVRYIAGIRHEPTVLRMLACHDLPWVRTCGRFGPDGMGHPEYRDAYEAARALAMRLASAAFPAKTVGIYPSIGMKAETRPRKLAVQIVSSKVFWHPEKGCGKDHECH